MIKGKVGDAVQGVSKLAAGASKLAMSKLLGRQAEPAAAAAAAVPA